MLQAVIAHGLGNAGNLAVAHVARGFRRYIARRKAASAAGEYDVGTNFIAGFENAACDKHAVVLDDNVAGNLPAFFFNKLFEGRASGVFLHGTRVGARDNGKFKSHDRLPFTFERDRIVSRMDSCFVLPRVGGVAR